jgi:hypothetical protein
MSFRIHSAELQKTESSMRKVFILFCNQHRGASVPLFCCVDKKPYLVPESILAECELRDVIYTFALNETSLHKSSLNLDFLHRLLAAEKVGEGSAKDWRVLFQRLGLKILFHCRPRFE